MENILFPSYKSFHQLFVDKTKLNMIRKYIWQYFINMHIAHKCKKGIYKFQGSTTITSFQTNVDILSISSSKKLTPLVEIELAVTFFA